ncbi:MAG: RNA 2',3'-cyclic phosphodiesterase [Clostridiaceae bacterium]|nr:RNA 2',3'-cyclic phosphodiesterase [Clostridiaceae bacterium]
MRTFIGIDFSRELKNKIYELQQELKKHAIKGRWKHIDNFHLTLKFLDEITLAQKAQIDEAMKKLCIDRSPFNLEINKLGIFNGKDSIRVLWLGVAGDIQQLQALQKEIDNALVPIGFEPEKRNYKPHVTIGQDIIFDCSFEQIRNMTEDIGFGTNRVNEIFLFKSEQVQYKRIYTKISRYDFRNNE